MKTYIFLFKVGAIIVKKKMNTSSDATERVEEIEVNEVPKRTSSEKNCEDYYTYDESEDYYTTTLHEDYYTTSVHEDY